MFLNALNPLNKFKTNKMVDEEKVHDIFLINPLDLLKLMGCFVKIILKNGEIIFGTVYTIDPVSQSVILISKEISQEYSLKVILKHSVQSMEVVSEIPPEQRNIISNNIFNWNQCTLSAGYKKEDVKSWLEKNMVPVVESGDKLIIDSLEICPPYGVEQCYSSNSIVLCRIQKLLNQMPCKNT